MAKLTEEQIERLREHWYKYERDKHIHISPDGKVIESDTPTDTWWCIMPERLTFYGIGRSVLFEKELVKKLFQNKDTSILELIFVLRGGYSK